MFFVYRQDDDDSYEHSEIYYEIDEKEFIDENTSLEDFLVSLPKFWKYFEIKEPNVMFLNFILDRNHVGNITDLIDKYLELSGNLGTDIEDFINENIGNLPKPINPITLVDGSHQFMDWLYDNEHYYEDLLAMEADKYNIPIEIEKLIRYNISGISYSAPTKLELIDRIKFLDPNTKYNMRNTREELEDVYQDLMDQRQYMNDRNADEENEDDEKYSDV